MDVIRERVWDDRPLKQPKETLARYVRALRVRLSRLAASGGGCRRRELSNSCWTSIPAVVDYHRFLALVEGARKASEPKAAVAANHG